jgi:hypothetical protein
VTTLGHNSPLLAKELKTALDTRKKKTATGPKKDSYEMLQHGGPALHDVLLNLYNLFYNHSTLPKPTLESIIALIHKKADKTLLANYRPVTLSSCFLKVFEKILESRLMEILRLKNSMNKLQICCRDTAGSIDALELVLESLHSEPFLIMCSIDLSKAFDRVDHDILFHKLLQKGIDGKLLRAIMATYRGHKTSVRIGNYESRATELKAGVKQGSILSPILFVIFMDELLHEIQKHHPNIKLPAVMYMDDLLLLPRNSTQLNSMFTIVSKLIASWGAVINTDKTLLAFEGHHHAAGICTFMEQHGMEWSRIRPQT